MKKLACILIGLISLILLAQKVSAQDFVYEPKNPSFGGNTFNYQWMLSSATSQNKLEDENDQFKELLNNDPLKSFQERLNQQILNELSRRLIAQQFGESGLKEGKFTIGDYEIDISSASDGVNVVVQDVLTGNQTTISIPKMP
ncbi:curli assembly protein CsgF [Adhaeribacter sp. BT258]|uniref:Curli production assembly/transport component CsgF n=1 Tax=Adhaeribacter terrigena TaxID=2793070 RepID=A0ABS1C807_9BACT|nr:curli production assembly/transport component CsgF [Adhaeribacter terrigena]MBK0404735.1 curli assembly protein CsgF [Adhaeribacter terrigena]